MCLIAPNALWALDFQFDTTEDNRTIKLLNVIDEFTRECPAIVVERSIDADRSWPPWTAWSSSAALRPSSDSTTVPSSSPMPWPTGAASTASARSSSTRVALAERLDRVVQRTARDELLNAWRFDSLLEAKVLIEDWRIDYNMNRPHSAHGDLTPSEFAQAWIDRHQPVPA